MHYYLFLKTQVILCTLVLTPSKHYLIFVMKFDNIYKESSNISYVFINITIEPKIQNKYKNTKPIYSLEDILRCLSYLSNIETMPYIEKPIVIIGPKDKIN